MAQQKPMRELTRIREEGGLSQQALADASGVNKATINQIERGRRSPNVETLEKLAAALRVEVADFFPKAQSPLSLEWLSDEKAPPLRLEDLPEKARTQLAERGYSDAYFVPVEEGEEEDKVEIRIYYVRLMDEDDRLLQKVRRLELQNAALTKQLEEAAGRA